MGSTGAGQASKLVTNVVRRLVVVTTHPIQYAAPWFRSLSLEPELELHVIFFRALTSKQQGVGFGNAFAWDVPLVAGYSHEFLEVESGAGSLPKLLFRLNRALRAYRPDALLITGWNESGLVLAYPLARLLGVPAIARGDSNSLRTRTALAGWLHRGLVRFMGAVTTVGAANESFYLANGVPASRIFRGCHFVESARMITMSDSHAGEREALRTAYGFETSEFVFLFCGKHVAFKRPAMLIEAVARLRNEGLAVALLFAGSGELSKELEARCQQRKVPARFLGFLNQTELWRGYVPADALVLPSDSGETWGLVVNEALLFGLPVISSNMVGCGPDLVIDGVTGYQYSGGADELAEAMRRLVTARDRGRSMGASGRALVLDCYSMPVATQALKRAIESVCR